MLVLVQRRSAGLLSVVGVLALMMCGSLLVQSATQPASASPAPGIGITIPSAAADGAAAVTGDAAGAATVAAGSGLTWGQGVAVFAGGMYAGCSIMGWVSSTFDVMSGHSCTQGFSVIGGWLGFGTGGDTRASTSTTWTTAPPNTAPACSSLNTACVWKASSTTVSRLNFPAGCTPATPCQTALELTCVNMRTKAVVSVVNFNGNFGGTQDWEPGSCAAAGATPAGTIAGDIVGVIRARFINTNPTPPIPTPIPDWQADPTPNAPLTSTVTVTCSDGSTESATVTWTPGVSTTAPTVKLPACPAGSVATALDTTSARAGGGSVATHTNVFTPTAIDNYPACAGGTTSPCLLQPRRIQPDGSSKGCIVGGGECSSWPGTDPARNYQCSWGTYTVPLSWCLADYPNGRPLPTAEGTGVPTETRVTSPAPTTDPTPTPTPAPIPLDGDNPTVDPFPYDPTKDPGSDGCWGTGWSWNPVSWVFVPVKCALEWAFVPPEGAVADTLGNGVGELEATGPGRWVGAFGGVIDHLDPPGASDCAGPGVTLSIPPVIDSFTFHPLSACTNPAAMLRTLIYAAASFAAVLGCVLVCVRLVAASFGLNIGWFGRGRATE